MQFINIPAEQTTAFTDLLLAVVSVTGVIRIVRSGFRIDKKKTVIWGTAFTLLALAALLGAIAHGFEMSAEMNERIWHPLNLFLGLSVGLFVIGVIYDFGGFKIRTSIFTLILLTGFVFFTITLMVPGLFFVFIIYEAVAMFFAFIAYGFLFFKRKFPGAMLMTIGILISIIAAVIQSIESLSLTIIYEFDHNGLFHIVQIIGLFFLFSGLVKEFTSRISKN
jgi:hypothetical protein